MNLDWILEFRLVLETLAKEHDLALIHFPQDSDFQNWSSSLFELDGIQISVSKHPNDGFHLLHVTLKGAEYPTFIVPIMRPSELKQQILNCWSAIA